MPRPRIRHLLAHMITRSVYDLGDSSHYQTILRQAMTDPAHDVADALSGTAKKVRPHGVQLCLDRIQSLADGRFDLDMAVTAESSAQLDDQLREVVDAVVDMIEASLDVWIHGSVPGISGVGQVAAPCSSTGAAAPLSSTPDADGTTCLKSEEC